MQEDVYRKRLGATNDYIDDKSYDAARPLLPDIRAKQPKSI